MHLEQRGAHSKPSTTLVNNYSHGCSGHCDFLVPTIQKGLIYDNIFRDMSSVLAAEERKAPVNLNISFCKNNHLCHIKYGCGGKDPSCKDSSLSLIFSNADYPENVRWFITCVYWKEVFVRRKEKRTLGIFYFLVGILAIGKEGSSFLQAKLVSHSSKNVRSIIVDYQKKNSIRKDLEKGGVHSNNQSPTKYTENLRFINFASENLRKGKKHIFGEKMVFVLVLICFVLLGSFT